MPTTNMIEWTASAGRIHANGEVFNIKGANWFGTEGQHAMLYGLEKHGLDYYLKFLAANKFNSLRLLFNHEYVLSDPPTPYTDSRDGKATFDPGTTPELVGTTYVTMLETIVKKAAEHNIVVLLAAHRIHSHYPGQSLHAEWPGNWDGLWFDGQYPESRILQSWGKLAAVLCDQWNVLGADLMNEPHGGGWGKGGSRKDWPRATEADEDNVWSAVRGAGEEGVEFVKTAIPTYREELSSDAARALPGEGEHC